MTKLSTQQKLHAIAKKAIPDDTDLWSNIERQVSKTETSSKIWRLNRRLGWVAAAVVILFSVSLVAYALDNILQKAIEMDPGLHQVNLAEMGTELDLSDTIDGYTVNLQWAYADGNRIAVGFTVTSSDGQEYANFTPLEVALIDERGDGFTSIGGIGAGVENDVGGYVLNFDARHIADPPEALQLRLKMTIEPIRLIEDEDAEPTLSPHEQAGIEPQDTTAMADVIDENDPRLVDPIGSFIFEFNVPVHAAQTYSVNETQTVEDIPITLTNIRVAPSMTTATFCIPPSNDTDYPEQIPIIRLETPNGEAIGGWGELFEDECIVASFVPTLDDVESPQDWVFIVDEVVGFQEIEPYGQERIAGPWVFEFSTP